MIFEAENDRIPFFSQYFSALILIANILVFFWQLTDPTGRMYADVAAFIPAEFFAGQKLWTIFTSMFMHADIVHIFMNMWFFYVIADNCEYSLGHGLFLFTYLISGICGSLLHAASTLFIPVFGPIMASIPSLGASGAIFGLMAVYGILFPKNRFYLPSKYGVRRIPALYFIMIYFISELIYGFFYSQISGTAHFAHIGGFIAGAIIALIFKGIKRKKTST
ncbi:MAG: rhomboid family intramembrane serine protease [Promethearchaeota archaeon]